MTATATHPDDLRAEAARLAFALLRFDGVAAHPKRGAATPDAYIFLPSWREVPGSEVEAFLVGLPSPALLLPTTLRGTVALLLLHELTGDRRRWAEKALSNFAAGLDELAPQLGLSPASRILVEFDDESHLFSFAAVREWARQFVVQVGWNLGALEGHDQADARLMLRRSDGQPFRGRSSPVPTAPPPGAPRGGAD